MFAGLVLATVVVLSAVSHKTGWPGAAALAAVSILWLLVNGSAEGATIWAVSQHHGLTETDLAGLAGLTIAAWRGWQGLLRHKDV